MELQPGNKKALQHAPFTNTEWCGRTLPHLHGCTAYFLSPWFISEQDPPESERFICLKWKMAFSWNQINLGMADGMCREGGGGRRTWFKESICPQYSADYHQTASTVTVREGEEKEIIPWQRFRENAGGSPSISVIKLYLCESSKQKRITHLGKTKYPGNIDFVVVICQRKCVWAALSRNFPCRECPPSAGEVRLDKPRGSSHVCLVKACLREVAFPSLYLNAHSHWSRWNPLIVTMSRLYSKILTVFKDPSS